MRVENTQKKVVCFKERLGAPSIREFMSTFKQAFLLYTVMESDLGCAEALLVGNGTPESIVPRPVFTDY